MDMQLLATKLYIPPKRSELVTRSRLLAHLASALECRLTLISAPAGFGKTTLMLEWVQQTGRSIAWVSLDEGDNDPVRFWRYVVAGLQKVDSTIGQTAQIALQAPHPPPFEPLVSSLVNELATAVSPIILVLDDYHLIHNEDIHKSLCFLLDYAPETLHLAMTTRADPPLMLSRRRARREMTEVRTADLRFTAEEVALFLNDVTGLNLGDDDVAALDERTEGWIVGLQMAALAMKSADHLQDPGERHNFVTTFTGDDRYVMDYLLEEVFQQQSSSRQQFLLRTSILERLCGGLCDAVCVVAPAIESGAQNGQTTLNQLEQENLFVVPLDNRRHWYRYHKLFADLLRQRLLATESAATIDALYRQASLWHEQEGFIDEAIAHALAMSQKDFAAALIERHVLTFFYRSEMNMVYRWLTALPEDVIEKRPLLCAVYANATTLLTDISPTSLAFADLWVQKAENALSKQTTPDAITRAFIATFQSFLANFRGEDPQVVIELALRALDLVPDDSLLFRSALAWNLGTTYSMLGDEEKAIAAFQESRRVGKLSGDVFNLVTSTRRLVNFALKYGRLKDAMSLCQETLPQLTQRHDPQFPPSPIWGDLYLIMGAICLEWNELEKAEQALKKGLPLSALDWEWWGLAFGYICWGRLQFALLDDDGVSEAVAQIDRAEPDSSHYAETFAAWVQLVRMDEAPELLTAVTQWAHIHQIAFPQDETSIFVGMGMNPVCNEQLNLIRLRIAQYRMAKVKPNLDDVEAFLSQQYQLSEANGQTDQMIYLLIPWVLLHQAKHESDKALDVLRCALHLAQPGGYVRAFLDEGKIMATLLQKLQGNAGELNSYIDMLLTGFDLPESQSPSIALIEPLSAREEEVLQLVAGGATNPQIAETLTISVYTVKKHITNIFGKLGVQTRTQAVARGREIGLLS